MDVHNKTVKKGLYRHYKGGEYRVIDIAKHSETTEWMVVYRCCYDGDSLWVRPYDMFFDAVQVNGESVPRFALITPEEEGAA